MRVTLFSLHFFSTVIASPLLSYSLTGASNARIFDAAESYVVQGNLPPLGDFPKSTFSPYDYGRPEVALALYGGGSQVSAGCSYKLFDDVVCNQFIHECPEINLNVPPSDPTSYLATAYLKNPVIQPVDSDVYFKHMGLAYVVSVEFANVKVYGTSTTAPHILTSSAASIAGYLSAAPPSVIDSISGSVFLVGNKDEFRALNPISRDPYFEVRLFCGLVRFHGMPVSSEAEGKEQMELQTWIFVFGFGWSRTFPELSDRQVMDASQYGLIPKTSPALWKYAEAARGTASSPAKADELASKAAYFVPGGPRSRFCAGTSCPPCDNCTARTLCDKCWGSKLQNGNYRCKLSCSSCGSACNALKYSWHMLHGIWTRDHCEPSTEFPLCLDPTRYNPNGVSILAPQALELFVSSKVSGTDLPMLKPEPVPVSAAASLAEVVNPFWDESQDSTHPYRLAATALLGPLGLESPLGKTAADATDICDVAKPRIQGFKTAMWDHPVVAGWSNASEDGYCDCCQLLAVGYKCDAVVSMRASLSDLCPQACSPSGCAATTTPLDYTAVGVDRTSCSSASTIAACLGMTVGCTFYYGGSGSAGLCLPTTYCPTWVLGCDSEQCLSAKLSQNVTMSMTGPCVDKSSVGDVTDASAPKGLVQSSVQYHSPHSGMWSDKSPESYCQVHLCYKALSTYNCTCKEIIDVYNHRMANPCRLVAPAPCIGTLYDQCPGHCIAMYSGAVDYHMGLTPLGQLKVNMGKLLAAVMLPSFSFMTGLLKTIIRPLFPLGRIVLYNFMMI